MSRRQSHRVLMTLGEHAVIIAGLVACFALPASAAAKPSYETFTVGKRTIDAQMSQSFRRCITGSRGETASMDDCVGNEHSRIYNRQFIPAYDAALKRVPTEAARVALRTDHAAWVSARKKSFGDELDRTGGGTAAELAARDRDLRELVRRYRWLQQYRR